MNETILAYNLGYRVNKSGELSRWSTYKLHSKIQKKEKREEFTSFLLK